MIRSMTGYGGATGTNGTAQLWVEVRTVNHRFFSPTLKLPSQVAHYENDIRERMRGKIRRGHATLSARVERAGGSAATLDTQRFREAHEALAALCRDQLLPPPTLADILRLPGVLHSDGDAIDSWDAELVLGVVDAALDGLEKMRTEEGARIESFLLDRLNVLEVALGVVRERAPSRLLEQHTRLRASAARLLDGLAPDEQRLSQEIAILADRLDISEELSRLDGHCAAFRATIRESHPEGSGKRLGFLLQEFLREVNTIASKGADSTILAQAVTMKEEIEKLREQCENIE